jgi:hypothetical protein
MAVLKYYNTTTSAWEYIAASTTANFTSWKKTATGGETSVSGTDDNAVTLSYTVGLEQVFINGVLQVRGSDYTATTGTSITGLTALVAGDIVTVVCYAPFNIANTIAPTVVDAKGDLLAGTAADTVGRLAVGTNGQVLAADSTASTGLKWTTAGKVLQVVSTVKTDTFTSATNSAWTDITGMSVSITPTSATSKVLVSFSTTGIFWQIGINACNLRIVRDSTPVLQGDAAGSRTRSLTTATSTASVDGPMSISYQVLDSPATTSATTYKLQFNQDSGGIKVNRGGTDPDAGYNGRYASVITVMEIGA